MVLDGAKMTIKSIYLIVFSVVSAGTTGLGQVRNEFINSFEVTTHSAIAPAAQAESAASTTLHLVPTKADCRGKVCLAQASTLLPLELPGSRPGPDRERLEAPSADPQRRSLYSVEGMALGSRVAFDSSAYREYRCEPSEQFSGFTSCRKVRDDRNRRGKFKSSYRILHSIDGEIVYINRELEPAFFRPNEANEDISGVSRKYGAPKSVIRLPRVQGLPDGIIAAWGDVVLEPLDSYSVSELAAGRRVTKGYMLDFIAHFQRSAQAGLPLYSLKGGPGFVYAASFDNKGRGTLRFAAVDASKFVGQHSGAPASDPLASSHPPVPVTRDQAWKKCQSPDADERLNGCTVVIAAKGYGSSKRLADALDGRCWALNDKGEFDRALTDCNAAIAANPSYSYAYNNRGTALLGLGKVEEAISAFTKSIELSPRFIFSRLARGRAFVIFGHKDKARKDFEDALILEPTNQVAREALMELTADQNPPSSAARPLMLPEASEVGREEEIR